MNDVNIRDFFKDLWEIVSTTINEPMKEEEEWIQLDNKINNMIGNKKYSSIKSLAVTWGVSYYSFLEGKKGYK